MEKLHYTVDGAHFGAFKLAYSPLLMCGDPSCKTLRENSLLHERPANISRKYNKYKYTLLAA